MGFFARPDLSDISFKQLPDSLLTLSGQTRIATTSGLTLTNGIGGFVPIIATGNTAGSVLTYRGGRISLEGSATSGESRYYCASPTTCTVGGLLSGSNITGCTITSILECILVPPIPLSTSLSVINYYSGGSTSASIRQFGDVSFGCLGWCVVKNTNDICGIIISTDGTGIYDTALLSGGTINVSTGGTIGYTFNEYLYADPSIGGSVPAASACTSTTAYYCLSAVSTTNELSSTSASILWRNKAYCFINNLAYYCGNCIGVDALMCVANQSFVSTSLAFNTSYTLNNEFFYYAYPAVLGTPSFTVNGLPNNAWGNLSIGTLFTMTFVNANNYSNEYYIARSDSRITGTYCIIAS
jgi:hypothetical protein